MINTGSMGVLRRDSDDATHGAPPTSKPARHGLRTERHDRASQALLAVETILFFLVLFFLSYGERIPTGP
jgi:hypothetical protein